MFLLDKGHVKSGYIVFVHFIHTNERLHDLHTDIPFFISSKVYALKKFHEKCLELIVLGLLSV
jgi:hypothetical protein